MPQGQSGVLRTFGWWVLTKGHAKSCSGPCPSPRMAASQSKLQLKKKRCLLRLAAIFADPRYQACATTVTAAFVMSFVQHPADFFIGSASLCR
jgi:hypothetical protein